MTKQVKKRRYSVATVVFVILMITCSTKVEAKNNYIHNRYIIEEDVYWESSYQGGSGRSMTVNEDNPYVKPEQEISVIGYSYLDAKGNILASEVTVDMIWGYSPTKPNGTVKTMFLICNKECILGWVDESCLYKRIPIPIPYFETAL